MPRDDETFLQERLAFNVLPTLGQPAPCANSATISFNGTLYGLYTNEEKTNHGYLKRIYPGDSDGDLFKGGETPETNTLGPDWHAAGLLGRARRRLDVRGGRHERGDRRVVGRDADQRRRRLLRRQAQLLSLRLPRQGVPVAGRRRRRQLRLARPERRQPDLLVDHALHTAEAGAALPDRHERSDLARQLHRRDPGHAPPLGRGEDPGLDRRLVGADRRRRRRRSAQGGLRRGSQRRRRRHAAGGERSGGLRRQVPRLRGRQRRRDRRRRRRNRLVQRLQRSERGRSPGAAEICGNGIDDDCNGLVDDGCPSASGAVGTGIGPPAPDAGSPTM